MTTTHATTTQLYNPLPCTQGRLWGEVRYQSGTLPTQYTYTGQYSHTTDFGLMYYVARWYDPVLGRFAQADTYVPGSQGVQAWDRFAYSVNNPLRYIDPTGHSIDCSPNDYQCQAEVRAEENGDDEPPFDNSLGGNKETEPEKLTTAQKIGLGVTAGLTSMTITFVEGLILVGGVYIAATGPVGIVVDVIVIVPVEIFLEDVKLSVNLYASEAILTGEKGEFELTILPAINDFLNNLFKP